MLQATDVRNTTQSLRYIWQNTGTKASVMQSSQVTAGTALIAICDAECKEVYSGNLATNGTFETTTRVAEVWTIRLELTDLSVTLSFRVRRAG